MKDLSKAIFLLDSITANMEWVKLLLKKDRIFIPLATYGLIMKRLEQVKEIIVNSNQIDSLKSHEGTGTPTKIKDRLFKTGESYIGTPTETFIFTGDNPFYRDSVGGEESLCSPS
uniref:Uncharacterized protein n=1 Tax=viral metagenome TaxID=1070528 RepID=A0A6M3KCN7_9ZZZZ